MLQLKNSTRFAANMALFPNEAAVDTLYVIVKATFDIGKDFTLADEQTPPVAADVYWTEAGKSSIKYASDMHIGKPSTDIVMLGHACVPGQKEATQLDVSLSVGKVNKTVRVIGDRQWQDGRMTPPAPFTTMAMVYEKAYGGVHIANGKMAGSETRNPVGRGFAGSRKAAEMNGVPLPNLEDPRQLISEYSDQPAPACFGFCAPNWHPRVTFAGTYDDAWQTTRAPYLPEDFDRRFFNMAHPDLIYPGYLQGGEPVSISNMHPEGTLKFDLPQVNLISHIHVAKRVEQPEFHLETLLLEPNQRKLSMVWRSAMPCDKQMLKVSEIKIGLTR
jgi:hypothetical protein